MSDIVISKYNEADIIVQPNDSGIVMELSEFFTFYVPGYKFVPSYRNKMWDGKIRLYNTRNYTLPSGLLYHVYKFAETRGYKVKKEFHERSFPKHNIPELDIYSNNTPITLHDYQSIAIKHAMTYPRSLLVSPTGSGKSLIIYMLMRWYLEQVASQFLIIVPTTSLVEQMYKDFLDYKGLVPGAEESFFKAEDMHRIYSGKDKFDIGSRVIITTWQSIYKLPESWFENVGAVVGDEAHLFKAKSLTTVMNKLKNAWMRIGTTGTLDGSKVHKLVLEGCFGPTYNVTSTKKLIDSKTLSDVSIDVLHLQYGDKERKEFGKKTYQEEISHIVDHEKRNNFIKNLTLTQKGNTLVLFNLVEKHGKPLYKLIRDKADINRKVFYVSGEVGALDREKIRTIVEKEKDAIIVASLGTFSTGINIKNLHNMIFAAPTKSQVRVLQSIGRSLRKSENGQPAKIYDLADDFSWKKRKNYTFNHGLERIDIYEKEQLNYRVHTVPM